MQKIIHIIEVSPVPLCTFSVLDPIYVDVDYIKVQSKLNHLDKIDTVRGLYLFKVIENGK